VVLLQPHQDATVGIPYYDPERSRLRRTKSHHLAFRANTERILLATLRNITKLLLPRDRIWDSAGRITNVLSYDIRPPCS